MAANYRHSITKLSSITQRLLTIALFPFTLFACAGPAPQTDMQEGHTPTAVQPFSVKVQITEQIEPGQHIIVMSHVFEQGARAADQANGEPTVMMYAHEREIGAPKKSLYQGSGVRLKAAGSDVLIDFYLDSITFHKIPGPGGSSIDLPAEMSSAVTTLSEPESARKAVEVALTPDNRFMATVVRLK